MAAAAKWASDPAHVEAVSSAVIATAEAAEKAKTAGIPPELLDKCLRAKASPAAKKATTGPKVVTMEQPAPAPAPEQLPSADKLVLDKLATKEAQEKCVRSVVAKYRAEQKKATAAPKKTATTQ